MVETGLTKARVRHHFAYSWWKYLAVIVASAFLCSTLYHVTRYQPPPEKTLDVYIAASGLGFESMRENLDAQLQEEFPDMEEINFYSLSLGGGEDYAGQMQFSTYIAAKQGDLYLIPRDKFAAFAKEPLEANVLLPLDTYLESGVIDARGLDYTKAERQGAVLGFPAEELYGLLDYGIVPQSLYFMIPSFSQNQEGAVRMVDFFIEQFQTEEPEGYDEYLRQLQMNLSPQQPGVPGIE